MNAEPARMLRLGRIAGLLGVIVPAALAPWRWCVERPEHPPPCVSGYVERVASGTAVLVCLDELEPSSCRVGDVRPGDRVRVGGGGQCVVEPAALSAERRLALGVTLDLNHESVAGLEALPGVGPKMAARIVAARPFEQVADLVRVRGIGPKRRAGLAPLVRVGDRSSPSGSRRGGRAPGG